MISRNTSFTYKGKSHNVREVGRKLGVRYVLEGSVRRAGNQVRVNAQLVETENGAQAWSERFEIAADDAYALHGQASAASRAQCPTEGGGETSNHQGNQSNSYYPDPIGDALELTKSTELTGSKVNVYSTAYERRTKGAKSGALERGAEREAV